jgi:type IV pilus assembly protein PilB
MTFFPPVFFTGRSHCKPATIDFVRTMIGECLRRAGVITDDQLEAALVEHERTGERLGAVLIRNSAATDADVARALASQFSLPYVDLSAQPPDAAAITIIPKDVALKRNCVAVGVEKNVLTVAMADPLLFSLVQDLEFQTGYRVKQVVATRAGIDDAIRTHYSDRAVSRPVSTRVAVHRREADVVSRGPTAAPDDNPIRREELKAEQASIGRASTADDAPIIDIVNLVIKGALNSRVSDIHIEPREDGLVVRHRLDGLLREAMDLPKWVQDGLIARVKIMAGLDIAERRLPQDGRIRAAADDGHEIDVRVSTLPTIFGEKIVLRLLDHRKGVPPLEQLGFSATALDQLRFFLRHQHGMILVVGPTGSGKTTTLSSALATIRTGRTNIVTIEDPVEYQLPGVNQTQINSRINLTFASALRSILRQDPDVVLLGEIRDQETARIAMQAAQTGHLVLSTLHTDDAPSCVTRLTDIGIEPYVTASALIGVVAQRLVRRLCPDCRSRYTPESDTLRAMGLGNDQTSAAVFYRAAGCHKCNRTGYRGRVGIYEIMPVTDDMRRLIARRGAETQLRDAAIASGMVSLGEDGLAKARAGMTTPQELLRVVTEVRHQSRQCPGCSTRLAPDFAACPSCGQLAGRACAHCRRPIQPEWRFCPYCTKATGTARTQRSCPVGAHPPRSRALPAAAVTETANQG